MRLRETTTITAPLRTHHTQHRPRDSPRRVSNSPAAAYLAGYTRLIRGPRPPTSQTLSPRRSHCQTRRASATNISRAQKSVSRSLGEINTAHATHAHARRIAPRAVRRRRSRRKPPPDPPQGTRPSSVGPRPRVGRAAATAARGRPARSSAAHRPSPVTCFSRLETLARSSELRREARVSSLS